MFLVAWSRWGGQHARVASEPVKYVITCPSQTSIPVAILPERRGFPPELGEYPTAEQNYHFGKLRVMEAGIGAPT